MACKDATRNGGEQLMTNKLFVGSLSWDTTDATLRDFFAQAGTVVSASVITDKFSGRSKGFGFVEMSNEEEAQKALQLNGQTLDGRAIVVNEAKPQAPREDRGGSRPFNRGGGGGGDRGGYSRGGGRGGDRGGDRGGRRPY
jgi:RNA recognition motif-containing protein